MQLSINNPATGQETTNIEADNSQSIDRKFKKLKDDQPLWAGESLSNRIEIIKKFAILLKENEQELAEILTSEVGKPLQQSINEINGGIARINWICKKYRH